MYGYVSVFMYVLNSCIVYMYHEKSASESESESERDGLGNRGGKGGGESVRSEECDSKDNESGWRKGDRQKTEVDG